MTQEYTVTVKTRSDAGLSFVVNSSLFLPSCPDLHITVKAVDKNTMEGRFADGRVITMARQ
jgi:hypothetical protein